MAKLKMQGLEEYENQLLKLENVSRECIGRAIHAGAREIADQVRQNIQLLPIDERKVKNGQMLHGITAAQKRGLLDGFGIARLQNDNGYMNVKLGFAGYNNVVTKSFPNGQPNSMIARSVNSGTSFRQKIPFVDSAVSAKRDAAEKAMKDTFDDEIKKVVK